MRQPNSGAPLITTTTAEETSLAMSPPVDVLAAKLLNRLRLRNMVVFLAAFEGKSITAAAQRVGLTQSAVSKKILELEDVVGAPLFTRVSAGIQPTLVGLATYAVCLRMKLTTHDFAKDLIGLRLNEGSRLALGFAPGFYSHKMNIVVSNLAEIFPSITITVSTLGKSELLNGLRCRSLTLGVGVSTSDIGDSFGSISVPAVRLAALVSDVHPLLTTSVVKPVEGAKGLFRASDFQSMKTYRWILPPSEELVSKAFERAFDGIFVLPHLETACFYEALMLARSTQFLMLVSEESLSTLIRLEGFSGVLLPESIVVTDAVAAYCRGGPLNAVDGYMLNAFRQFSGNTEFEGVSPPVN